MSRLIPLLLIAYTLSAEPTARRRPPAEPYRAPDIKALLEADPHDLRAPLERYQVDRDLLGRFYTVGISPTRDRAMKQFFESWSASLDNVDFNKLAQEGRIDYILFRKELRRELRALELSRQRQDEIAAVVPYAQTIIDLRESRQRVDPLDARAAAATLVAIKKQLDSLAKRINAEGAQAFQIRKTAAARAARTIENLREILADWHKFYNNYDPLFTWWMAEPYKDLNTALTQQAKLVREKLAGVRSDDKDTILGDPIGKEFLLRDLDEEMIPYSPEQLIKLANDEFAWCDKEMLRASRELGFGDDWRRALEHVKNLYVAPGQQTSLVLDLAVEAIEYLDKHQLITVPPLARDVWRMEMMSPERQRVAPFFLGGEAIIVSYPTDTMTHEQKMMSMRGNNPHFSRSTVFHELIPGHNLQRFMNARNRTYRQVFATPFWSEGWAFYWEMLLWDRGFPRGPEDRIGMLFWRMHRCARIIFSLSFHLEKMTAQECVKFLIDRVGHEPENAAAEVRRSFETSYPPLYQSAYMLGALQFYALHKEMAGRMPDRDFHDAVMRLNSMPVEMVRASLMKLKLDKEFKSNWKFYGEVNP